MLISRALLAGQMGAIRSGSRLGLETSLAAGRSKKDGIPPAGVLGVAFWALFFPMY